MLASARRSSSSTQVPRDQEPPTTELAEAQADPRISQSFNGTLIYIEALYFPIGESCPVLRRPRGTWWTFLTTSATASSTACRLRCRTCRKS